MADGIDLLILLLVVVVALATLAARINLPYPMLLLVGGIVVALVPGMPDAHLDPHLVFVIFLPPVLFEAAYFTSWRDFSANRRPIGLLAVGSVLITMVVVGVVARQVFDGMSWATALTLGAIVSPPDAVSASAIFRRVGAPHRIVTILEGESLVNDATALIAYRFAVAAVVGGAFSLREASLQFVLVSIGGILLGLACGWLLLRVIPVIDDSSLQIAATLVIPSAIYVLAEGVHVSGVLTVVTAGLVFGRYASRSLGSESRLGAFSVWQTGLVLINGLVFILIGLQLGVIVDHAVPGSLFRLIGQALLISLAVILARIAWVFPAAWIPRWLVPNIRRREPPPQLGEAFVIAWSGLRGVVSLASALALPLTIDSGTAFPWRDEIVLVTFVVIVVTLLGQGLPLPWLLRRLRLEDDGEFVAECWTGRRIAAVAIVDRLTELEPEAWVPEKHAEILRSRYEHMLDEIPDLGHEAEFDRDHLDSNDRLRADVVEHARRAVLQARNEGRIGDAARFRVESELDREYLRTEL